MHSLTDTCCPESYPFVLSLVVYHIYFGAYYSILASFFLWLAAIRQTGWNQQPSRNALSVLPNHLSMALFWRTMTTMDDDRRRRRHGTERRMLMDGVWFDESTACVAVSVGHAPKKDCWRLLSQQFCATSSFLWGDVPSRFSVSWTFLKY